MRVCVCVCFSGGGEGPAARARSAIWKIVCAWIRRKHHGDKKHDMRPHMQSRDQHQLGRGVQQWVRNYVEGKPVCIQCTGSGRRERKTTKAVSTPYIYPYIKQWAEGAGGKGQRAMSEGSAQAISGHNSRQIPFNLTFCTRQQVVQ